MRRTLMSPLIEKVEAAKAQSVIKLTPLRSERAQMPIFVKIAMIPVSSALRRPNVIT